MLDMKNCNLCPRECGINRERETGFCRAPKNIRLARAALHFWEEPIISGTRGSGAVFFSFCNLLCAYCQNEKISRQGFGKDISPKKLGEIFLSLQDQGAHNINLVTPTPYVPLIIRAIDGIKSKLFIPVVYNCGGYERPETIRALSGYIDIYLTDFKYLKSETAQKYSAAANYAEFAKSSLGEMIKTVGKPKIEDGIMKSGVIVRHLVLPSLRQESIEILRQLRESFGTDSFILSLMSQYFPPEGLKFSELNRRVTSFEYNSVLKEALALGFDNAYIQERESASESFVPDFDLSGLD